MRVSTITAFAATFLGVLGAALPNPSTDVALDTRQSLQATVVVSTLYTNIQQYSSQINSTCASITPHSSYEERASAQVTIQSCVSSMTSLMTSANAQLRQCGQNSNAAEVQVSANYMSNCIFEINGSYSVAIGVFGKSWAYGCFNPCVSLLNSLMISADACLIGLLSICGGIVGTAEHLISGVFCGIYSVLSWL